MNKNKLQFYDIFYIFLFGCFFGWIVELIWSLIKKHRFINHSALVLGPFNVIYGFGAIALTCILFKMRKANVFKIYVASFFTGSILEYAISYLTEHLVGFSAWNYSQKFMNLNGRICLPYSLFWGLLGVIWIKLLFPKIKQFIDSTNHKEGTKLMKITIIFLIFDIFLTFAAMDRARAFEKGIPPSNKVEEVLDTYFGSNYLNNMFNNRWYKKK